MSWRTHIPDPVRDQVRTVRRRYRRWKQRRPVDMGDLRRLTPIDPAWGYTRGRPIDRVYVAAFLGRHSADIKGRVLEIASPAYTNQFGKGVTSVDVLMASEGNPEATIVGDLTDAPHIADDSFDCAVVTQTLQFIFDTRAALTTLHRILAPNGVVLITTPGLTKISGAEDETWGQWWHFTSRSIRRLAEECFGEDNVEVSAYGNILAATGFLYGLAGADLKQEELDFHDPLYEVIIGVRAVKR